MFPSFWQALPDVIASAELVSRANIPDYWSAHDRAGTSGGQFIAFGMWIFPKEGFAEFEVGCDPLFSPDEQLNLPVFPERTSIIVKHALEGGITESRVVSW
jgi:hypothetical protein